MRPLNALSAMALAVMAQPWAWMLPRLPARTFPSPPSLRVPQASSP
ncbi:hypothetical protein DB31_9108 [Hyalangium minutum]|uniref:Uncharacterized protein n=1 Tax=Hyalangium minutum TaxID=394096 RepID=A0A085WGT1_9BACT|nr:hypothetical protein DB31_9108 [Hyalangium minutum]